MSGGILHHLHLYLSARRAGGVLMVVMPQEVLTLEIVRVRFTGLEGRVLDGDVVSLPFSRVLYLEWGPETESGLTRCKEAEEAWRKERTVNHRRPARVVPAISPEEQERVLAQERFRAFFSVGPEPGEGG